jgi:hypothetical protein
MTPDDFAGIAAARDAYAAYMVDADPDPLDGSIDEGYEPELAPLVGDDTDDDPEDEDDDQ